MFTIFQPESSGRLSLRQWTKQEQFPQMKTIWNADNVDDIGFSLSALPRPGNFVMLLKWCAYWDLPSCTVGWISHLSRTVSGTILSATGSMIKIRAFSTGRPFPTDSITKTLLPQFETQLLNAPHTLSCLTILWTPALPGSLSESWVHPSTGPVTFLSKTPPCAHVLHAVSVQHQMQRWQTSFPNRRGGGKGDGK